MSEFTHVRPRSAALLTSLLTSLRQSTAFAPNSYRWKVNNCGRRRGGSVKVGRRPPGGETLTDPVSCHGTCLLYTSPSPRD